MERVLIGQRNSRTQRYKPICNKIFALFRFALYSFLFLYSSYYLPEITLQVSRLDPGARSRILVNHYREALVSPHKTVYPKGATGIPCYNPVGIFGTAIQTDNPSRSHTPFGTKATPESNRRTQLNTIRQCSAVPCCAWKNVTDFPNRVAGAKSKEKPFDKRFLVE